MYSVDEILSLTSLGSYWQIRSKGLTNERYYKLQALDLNVSLKSISRNFVPANSNLFVRLFYLAMLYLLYFARDANLYILKTCFAQLM